MIFAFLQAPVSPTPINPWRQRLLPGERRPEKAAVHNIVNPESSGTVKNR